MDGEEEETAIVCGISYNFLLGYGTDRKLWVHPIIIWFIAELRTDADKF